MVRDQEGGAHRAAPAQQALSAEADHRPSVHREQAFSTRPRRRHRTATAGRLATRHHNSTPARELALEPCVLSRLQLHLRVSCHSALSPVR